MKGFLQVLILIFLLSNLINENYLYCQTDSSVIKNDKVHMKNGQILEGKVKVIKKDEVEFTEYSTNLSYELQKSDIKVILLSNGKSISFSENKTDSPVKKDTVVVEKDGGTSPALIILGAVGAVLIVLLLIGAAAQ